ncbi:MAG: Uma2 family endonuclease [Myxococcales bacterium]|nr:Uma2 family endonuclease [Myxococcales bacterium]
MNGQLELGSPDPEELQIDQRVVLHGIPWGTYEAFLRSRGESTSTRVTYLEGELEIMTPSFGHEWIKTTIGLLLGVWAEETETALNGIGSWTIRRRQAKRGAEADQCYLLGNHRPPRPDLAVEVIWTPGGLDKLEVWRKLGVPEVWFWREGKFEVHVLHGGQYLRRRRSELLPDLDLELLARYVRLRDQPRAMREYRSALRRN